MKAILSSTFLWCCLFLDILKPEILELSVLNLAYRLLERQEKCRNFSPCIPFKSLLLDASLAVFLAFKFHFWAFKRLLLASIVVNLFLKSVSTPERMFKRGYGRNLVIGIRKLQGLYESNLASAAKLLCENKSVTILANSVKRETRAIYSFIQSGMQWFVSTYW